MQEAVKILMTRPTDVNGEEFDFFRNEVLERISKSIRRKGSAWNNEAFLIGPHGRAYVSVDREVHVVNFTWYEATGDVCSFWMTLSSVVWLLEMIEALPVLHMDVMATPVSLSAG